MDQQQTERWLSRHGSDSQAPHLEHALSVEFGCLHEKSQRTYCNQSVRHTNRFFCNGETYVGQTVLEADTPGFLSVLSEGPYFREMLPDDPGQPIKPTSTEEWAVFGSFFAGIFALNLTLGFVASPLVYLVSTLVFGIASGVLMIGVLDFLIPAWRTHRYLQSVDDGVVLTTETFDGYREIDNSSMKGTEALEAPEPQYCVGRSTLPVPELDELIDRIEREGARTVADRRRERLIDFVERCRGKHGEKLCRRIPIRYKHIGGHDSALIDVQRFDMPGLVADNRSLRLRFSALHKITLQEDSPCRMVIHQHGERETIVYHPDWFDTVGDRAKKLRTRRDEARQVMLYESRFLLALSSVRDFG